METGGVAGSGDQVLNHLAAELAQLFEPAGVEVGQPVVVEPEQS